MKKAFKRIISSALASVMVFSSLAFTGITVSAAGFSTVGGWNESLYAEWLDSNPDAANVKVEYKLSSASGYTALAGDDLTYLVRKDGSNGRVDIPGLKAGRYDLKVTASDGTSYERTGIKVESFDRSGYAHWNRKSSETAYTGVGAYKDDGTLKENAIVVYVTDENKDTVTLKDYETFKATSANTNQAVGFGNIFNNNIQLMEKATVDDNHPIVVRIIGNVTPPKNLTPGGTKDPILGGGTDDNGNLAIIKKGRNITIEGIGDDAHMNGWGVTFSQTSTCREEEGQSFEIRNLTIEKYPEDGVSFQGDYASGKDYPIQRVWVHNNVFLPGYAAHDYSKDKDKGEGDGSCDFKRGMYYTLSYNHFINCHKTNLLGSGSSDRQWYMTLHHNWYENVESRQPLAANGNVHIYSTYFEGIGSVAVDLREQNATFLEENYYGDTKATYFKSRDNTCYAKSYNEITPSGGKTSIKGTRVVATSRSQNGIIKANSFNFPNGDTMQDFDTNPTHFYYANGKSNVEVMTPAADVPEYVKTYAGTMQPLPVTESGEVVITVKDDKGANVDDAVLTGMDFHSIGNGQYSAAAELGVSYDVTVSKEGYSNQSFKTDAINEDGGRFEKTVTLAADNNGYAAVMLTGGSGKTPIKGAVVRITGSTSNGVELKDKGDGLYQSDSEIAIGSYNVTITNTGDYVEPSSAQDITVRTTNAPTEINLEKYKATVNVKLEPDSGETQPLDVSKAKVSVGNTQLTRSGITNTFTGQIEVGTPYSVSVSLVGWNTVSIIPSTVTVAKGGSVTATAKLRYKGQLFTWNYTDGTNTDNFFKFGSLSDWSSADDNPQTFEDYTLTKAVKVGSEFTATFEAPADGTITLVMEAKDGSSVYVNDKSYDISTGINVFPVNEGPVTVKKNKTESHLYLMQYAADGGTGGGTVTPPDPVEPDETPAFTVGTVTAPKGGTAKVPVSISGVNNDAGLGFYNITLKYDSTKLKYVKTENNITGTRCELSANGNTPGQVVIAAVNGNDKVIVDDTVLCNVYFTANDSDNISISVTQALGINNAELKTSTTANGKVTVTQDTGSIPGDADNDNDVDKEDALAVLKYISGIDLTLIKNFTNADCDKKAGIDMGDVIFILANPKKAPEVDPNALTAGTYDAAAILSDNRFKYSDNAGSNGAFKISNSNGDGYLSFTLAQGASVTVTYLCGSSNDTKKITGVTLTGPDGKVVETNTTELKGGDKTTKTVGGTNLPAGTYRLTFENDPLDTTLQINSVVVE